MLRSPVPIYLTLSVVSALILFSACRKHDANSNVINPISQSTLQPMLSKVFELDTTLTAPFDTMGRISYFYDDQNRIISVTDIETGVAGDTSSFSKDSFFYTGSDSIANKKISIYSYYYPNYSADTEFYRHQNGHLVSDSLIHGPTTLINRYIYGNDLLWFRGSISTSQHDSGIGIVHRTFFNNDISSQQDTIVTVGPGLPNVTFDQREYATITYLPNPNPFYLASRQTHVAVILPVSPGIEGNDAPQHLVQNDIRWGQWQTGGVIFPVQTYTASYTYHFRDDGYPVSAVRTLTGNANTIRKILYLYR